MIRVLICGAMGLARLVELAWSRRNLRGWSATEEGRWSRRSFPLMVGLHVGVIGGTLLFGAAKPRRLPLALLLTMQPLRLWTLATLGPRWNARGIVPSEMTIATTGPYAFVRHPNYDVVAVELATLPATFGLDRLAITATVLNALLLTLRIHDEEALLFALAGYAEHFESKPRFLPRLF